MRLYLRRVGHSPTIPRLLFPHSQWNPWNRCDSQRWNYICKRDGSQAINSIYPPRLWRCSCATARSTNLRSNGWPHWSEMIWFRFLGDCSVDGTRILRLSIRPLQNCGWCRSGTDPFQPGLYLQQFDAEKATSLRSFVQSVSLLDRSVESGIFSRSIHSGCGMNL